MTKVRISRDTALALAVALALGSFAVPASYYASAVARGDLPQPDTWFVGHNHGPWRGSWPGTMVLAGLYLQFALLLLVVSAGVTSPRPLPGWVRWRYVAAAGVLCAVLILYIRTLFWTID